MQPEILWLAQIFARYAGFGLIASAAVLTWVLMLMIFAGQGERVKIRDIYVVLGLTTAGGLLMGLSF